MIAAKSAKEDRIVVGTPRLCVVYLVGNPIIAMDIFDVDIRAGTLVPFRVEVYGRRQGRCGFIRSSIVIPCIFGKARIGWDRKESRSNDRKRGPTLSMGA